MAAGLWELLGSCPRSLRTAVHGTIARQPQWTERHPDLARFIYMRGNLVSADGAVAGHGESTVELGTRPKELSNEL